MPANSFFEWVGPKRKRQPLWIRREMGTSAVKLSARSKRAGRIHRWAGSLSFSLDLLVSMKVRSSSAWESNLCHCSK